MPPQACDAAAPRLQVATDAAAPALLVVVEDKTLDAAAPGVVQSPSLHAVVMPLHAAALHLKQRRVMRHQEALTGMYALQVQGALLYCVM